MKYRPDFSGKTAVVTGGTGVLCAEMCRELAAAGANVAIIARGAEKAEKLAAEIKAAGGSAIAAPADVTDRDALIAAHEKILAAFGKCDILINGAGGNNPMATTDDEMFDEAVYADPAKTSLFDLDPSAFDTVFGLNIKGTLLPSQIFGADMAGREGGVILNISSMNAFTPLTKIPAYSSAKAAVSNFTRWLSVYFAKAGVRVNALAPGFFSTAQNAKLLWNEDGTPTARTGKILRNTPMDRFGKPEELIGGMFYLLDNDASGFVTGVVLPIDGGFSAYSGV